MRTIDAVIIRNSREEHTVAIVRAEIADDFGCDERGSGGSPDDVTVLWGRIQLAVTEWFFKTDQGKAAIRSNNYDFNIGDLAEWKEHDSLVPFLRRQGIHSLEIDIHSDTAGHCWDFDDVLFDDMEINADNDRALI
jgi:hypothetical protein